jgi:hypothetical protein
MCEVQGDRARRVGATKAGITYRYETHKTVSVQNRYDGRYWILENPKKTGRITRYGDRYGTLDHIGVSALSFLGKAEPIRGRYDSQLPTPFAGKNPGWWNHPLGPWKSAHVIAFSTSVISSQKGTEQ